MILSVVSSVMVVALAFFQWHLVHILTPFLMPFLWLMAGGFFLVTMIFSIIAVIKRQGWKPVLIQSLTIVFIIFFPFTKVVLNMDFEKKRAERETVVKQVQEGAITSNASYNDSLIHLPKRYEKLSSGGGDILVEKKKQKWMVLFFTFRGILDSFSGFVYSSSGEKPRTGDFGGDFIEIEQLYEHWYFVSSG
ncbi:hypothetical protein [Rossellomorea arthrocnemi]|uniref:hypothetical protein n=1 Tax=Rossellomorea arthrocnemi TaxID=2769542 RepID=UPI0019181C61|nr:hypothetical protein [Rossellomorea arthrocnemi]